MIKQLIHHHTHVQWYAAHTPILTHNTNRERERERETDRQRQGQTETERER